MVVVVSADSHLGLPLDRLLRLRIYDRRRASSTARLLEGIVNPRLRIADTKFYVEH